jgi:RHS repeat-associated protein
LYVGYTYDTTKNGDYFTKRLRPTTLRYPSNTTINYVYGASNSIDDKLNRFVAVKNGTTTVVEYLDTGLATPAKVTYSQPGLTLDYTTSGALDRFGRITDHAWKNSNGNDLVRIKHGYDRIGNRLYREDVAATNAGKAFDELYSYDGMNQLIDMQRGTIGANKASIVSQYKNWEEQFIFDATGNFANYKQDTNGDGTFELNQPRTHSKANEILTVASSTSLIASDRNGNMTKIPKPDNWSAAYDLVYDAWNRLVTVKSGSTIVATYFYDGTNRRVKKVVGSETRVFYFNQNWQCLEEYVGNACDVRFVWGLRYVDDLVTYRKGATDYYALQDANWNVVALTNAAGAIQERYNYSAFGKLNVFDAAFIPKAASTFSLTRSFTGQVLDNETGLMLYRNRVYHPALGRFIQRDPIGYKARDINLMRYVLNKPILYLDITGYEGVNWYPSVPTPVPNEGECFFHVCETPVAGRLGVHSFIILYNPSDGTWDYFRGGPEYGYTPLGNSPLDLSKPSPNAGEGNGNYDLQGDSGDYLPGTVDYPITSNSIPKCRGVTVPCESRDKLYNCFAEVIKRVNDLDIDYVPAPLEIVTDQGNCNTLTSWMQKICTGDVKFPILPNGLTRPGTKRLPNLLGGDLVRIHPEVKKDFPKNLLPK